MLPATDKEETGGSLLKLAQMYTAIQKREHEERRKMVVKNILKKKGDINFQIPETEYTKTFRPNLIGCSALHLAFTAGNFEIFNDILQHGADFTMKYNDMTVVHRAIEENFEKHEISKLTKRFKQYGDRFTNQNVNSFIVMNNNIKNKNVNECDNWRLRSILEDSFIDSVLSAQIEYCNSTNPRSKHGLSHFHAACMTNNFKAVALYLEHGIDVHETVDADSPIYSGYKPIHFAVRCSGLGTVQELLKHKVNVNDKDGQGKVPLQILVDHNIKIIEWMSLKKELPYESSIVDYVRNEKIIKMLIESSDAADVQYLYAACTLKSTSTVESLLKKVANINEADPSTGYTALHFAAFFNMETVKMLLKNGADIEAKDDNGITPLDILATKASIDDVHFVLSTKDAWKNILLSDGKTRLIDLISYMQDADKLDSFLKSIDVNASIPVDSPLWAGYTILHLATIFSETSKVQSFLANIPDCATTNFKEEFEKCCQKQEEVHHARISACLRRNANVNIQDVRGWTPIHLAFRQRKMNVVKLLLQHIKNFKNITDQDNLSLLHISCAAGYRGLVKKLLSTQDLDTPISSSFKWDSNFYGSAADDVFKIVGSSPLHIAVAEENVEIVKILVSSVADVNAKDADELTPVHRVFALKSIWKIGDEIFHWFDLRRSMIDMDTPEMDRYRNVMANIDEISEILLASPTSKEIIDSSFSIHERPLANTSDTYSFESGETLLEQGVDLLAKQDNGSIWLFDKFKRPYDDDVRFIATMMKQDEAMKNRLDREFGWTTLHVACSLFDVELGTMALSAGIDVNARTFKDSPLYPGCSPLHVLMLSLNDSRSYQDSKENYETLLQLLLDNGADVSLTDINNDTPVHRSDYSTFWTSHSFKESLYTDLLLEHIKNFNVNPINTKGFSIFHVACLKQNYRAIEGFIKHGVDVNRPMDLFAFDSMDTDEFAGYTPLHLAVEEKPKSPDAKTQLEIIELLLKHGANINSEDAFGNTPLHVAAASEQPNEAVLQLIAE